MCFTRSNPKRLAVVLVLLFCVGSLLSACSGGSSTSTSKSASKPTVTSIPAIPTVSSPTSIVATVVPLPTQTVVYPGCSVVPGQTWLSQAKAAVPIATEIDVLTPLMKRNADGVIAQVFRVVSHVNNDSSKMQIIQYLAFAQLGQLPIQEVLQDRDFGGLQTQVLSFMPAIELNVEVDNVTNKVMLGL